MAQKVKSNSTRRRISPFYIHNGSDNEVFQLRLDRPIRKDAEAAMDKIYGKRIKPPLSHWLGHLIAVGTAATLKEFASGSFDAAHTAKR